MSVQPLVENQAEWQTIERRSLYAGGAGVVLLALIAVFNVKLLLHSYLVAYLFWLGVALGSLALLMVQHLTGGGWGLVIRRILESGTRTLPLLAVLFLPLLLGLRDLYSWARAEEVAGDPLLQHKQAYLNVPFFLLRAVLYFAVWLGAAFLLNKWSRQQDEAADAELSRKFQRISAPGLGLYGLTITFASIDWAMSLEPHWFSTIYGVLFGIGQVLSAFALTVAVVALLSTRPPLAGVVTATHFRDLGGLLLAIVMLWAYVSLSQYLLIWSGNLPEETPWYLQRLQGGWQAIGLTLILLHFALPFLLLLSKAVKQNPRMLGIVALGVLFMRVVDTCWLIVPAFSHGASSGEPQIPWMDLGATAVALVGFGGVWLAVFLKQLRSRPLLPVHDPYFAEVMHHV